MHKTIANHYFFYNTSHHEKRHTVLRPRSRSHLLHGDDLNRHPAASPNPDGVRWPSGAITGAFLLPGPRFIHFSKPNE